MTEDDIINAKEIIREHKPLTIVQLFLFIGLLSVNQTEWISAASGTGILGWARPCHHKSTKTAEILSAS